MPTMCQALCQALHCKSGAIIVLILLSMEVSHRDESQSLFRAHGLVSVLSAPLHCLSEADLEAQRPSSNHAVLGMK